MRLNRTAYDYAKQLVNDGHFVLDERDDWSEHQPTAAQENKFIEEDGWRAYARWHLGVDHDRPEDTKGRYGFPYGDFQDVHRCGVLSAESRAAQNDYDDIEKACAHLHGMLDAHVGAKQR
ncbi:MAG: hypothetical protein JWN32_1763 [Solirubrobacterales bacterium]|jgi:hypothetical protein|nr:hypothetical protein [Solirubrobacterales bacterium]